METFGPNLYSLEISTDKISAVHFFVDDRNKVTVYLYLHNKPQQKLPIGYCANTHILAYHIIEELKKHGAL